MRALAPAGTRRMGSNPHANGGRLLQDLPLPDFREFAVEVPSPGATTSEATRVLGAYLREVMSLNCRDAQLPLVGPDETVSNRLGAVLR